MQTYYDTSALIALYMVEEHTGAIEAHTAAAGVPIMIHDLHRLEAGNGLRAKVFRKEMKEAQCRGVLDRSPFSSVSCFAAAKGPVLQ